MKTTKTKNFKDLETLMESCAEDGDTMFVIYSSESSKIKDGDVCGTVTFTGNPKRIANGMTELLRDACRDDAPKGAEEVANAFLNAIVRVLEPHDDISMKFASLLSAAIDAASRDHFKKKLSSILSDIADFAEKYFDDDDEDEEDDNDEDDDKDEVDVKKGKRVTRKKSSK